MRADRAKNVAKVAKAIMENPLRTEREIAEELGIANGTVNSAKKELEQSGAKDDRIIGLTDGDFELMQIIQAEKRKRLKNAETINHNDLDRWENTAVKRYSLFRGNATDENGGLNGISSIEIL